MSIYSMSKSALDMFTKCLALELGPKGIRVNVVNPSGVRTDFSQAMGVDKDSVNSLLEVTGSSYPLGRIGEPIDIANAVLFLASDECSFVTAINFVADGGALWGAPPPKLR
ncbi:unnamed protein product [Oppiella nova]|uniref:Uncharacterized protein n=1 Tax=Oppiella nova TaxID=334625 RepID=A0A7R9MR15_9ACAR|nr:unnamed protein product [Oppiella nova]CAG2181485.1 unnamed protein product [Oppiella nova]